MYLCGDIPCDNVCLQSIGNKFLKCPYELKPARASAFINTSIRLNPEGPTGTFPKGPYGILLDCAQYCPNMFAA